MHVHDFEHDPLEVGGIDPLSAQALRAYKRSMMLNRRLMTSFLSQPHIHPAQAGCLQMLLRRDGVGQSDLADTLHVSRPTVTTMLQRMESAGLVRRTPDETDSRITRVYLTDEGRALAEHLHDAFSEMTAISIGSLSEDDRRELIRVLSVMNDNVATALAARGNVPTHVHFHEHEDR